MNKNKFKTSTIYHEFKGSAKRYRLDQIAQGNPVPSEAALRKMLSERSNEITPLHDWFSNTMMAAQFAHNYVNGKKLEGYCQQITPYPQLSIFNFCEKQLLCVKSTAYEDRFLHFDASGGYINITKKQAEPYGVYKRNLVYNCLLKNNRNDMSTIIGQLISCSHDVLQLNHFWLDFKFKYEKIFSDRFHFRLITTDNAFAIIHSLIDTLNKDSINEYAEKVFKLASGDTKLLNSKSYSWIASCVAHTMKRLANSLKVFNLNVNQKRYVCFAFSLLLNSTTLVEISTYFEKMCTIFLSEFQSQLKLLRGEITSEKKCELCFRSYHNICFNWDGPVCFFCLGL
jgi:hypothetical protein